MFPIPNFYLFLSASIMINLAPGPDMLYTAARSLSQGTKAGVLSAVGICAGCLFHISAAVFGLSAIIESSVLVFSIIKFAGAAYLIYLGLRAFIKSRRLDNGLKNLPAVSSKRIFFQGMLTNILNPKVAIFFLSFLPQFIDPHSAYLREQIAFLGSWFALQGTLILIGVATLTGLFSAVLQKNAGFWKWQGKITGLILFSLGLKVLISEK